LNDRSASAFSPFLSDLGSEHLDRVLQIELEANPHPWKREQFAAELCNEYASLRGAFVAQDTTLQGFLCTWLVADEMEILNVATHPSCRRHGIASLLLRDCVDRALAAAVTRIHLEVRSSNVPAIALYRRFAFAEVGLRRAYYAPNGEDAILMCLELPSHVAF
jgi:ribosomal-protein-alanine N-acetyltransferase